MSKRKRKTIPFQQNKKQQQAPGGLDTLKARIDPLQFLPWDCTNLVLQYLDIRDLARCEQVGRAWRDFVQRWMVDVGRRYCLPGDWTPDITGLTGFEEAVRTVRKSVVEYAAYRKFTSGNASCARRYEASAPGLFDSNGDFAVWHAGESIFWQNLRFQDDGSLHPVQKLAVRVTRDNMPYLGVNAEETGKWLWKRRTWPDTKLFAIGKERVYLVSTDPGKRTLTARDIKSGRLLYEVPVVHSVRRSRPPVPVQQRGGEEVIVNIHSVSMGGTIVIVNGLQIINGKDGRVLQTIATRIWVHGSQIIPRRSEEGGFAVLSHFRSTHWYVKIQKFSQDPNGRAFRSESTEVLQLGQYPHPINEIAIEPYRYIAVSLEGRRALPRVIQIRQNSNPTIDRRTLPPNTVRNTDKWLCIGSGQEVTLPQKYAHHKARRLFIPGPFDHGAIDCRLNIAGWDRVGLLTDPRKLYCLFDFRFRLPSNIGSKILPDPGTLEKR
ncbi:hypothetical protein BDW62DRAFT_212517 [Aspergillus aurantiobrunneus]